MAVSHILISVYAKERKVKGIKENTCYYWLSE